MPKVLKILKHHLTYTLILTHLSESSPASVFLFLPGPTHWHSPEHLQPSTHKNIPCYSTFLHSLWSSELCGEKKKKRRTFLPREFAVLLSVLLLFSLNAQNVPSLSSCLMSLLSLVDMSEIFLTSWSTYL